MPSDRGALNQTEAAAWLSVSVPHFRDHVRPRLESVYIRSATRYAVMELQRYLDAHAG